jgi:hypothetical protein
MPQFVMTPTIRTHCFLRWGRTPVPTLESERWLRTGGLLPLDTNKLDTPLGDCMCRGLLLQDTQSSDVRGSFYWTPKGWAHPWVAYCWGLLSLDTLPFDLSICFFFSITGILGLPSTTIGGCQDSYLFSTFQTYSSRMPVPPTAFPWPFQVCFWGGHVPLPNPRISLKMASLLQ